VVVPPEVVVPVVVPPEVVPPEVVPPEVVPAIGPSSEPPQATVKDAAPRMLKVAIVLKVVFILFSSMDRRDCTASAAPK